MVDEAIPIISGGVADETPSGQSSEVQLSAPVDRDVQGKDPTLDEECNGKAKSLSEDTNICMHEQIRYRKPWVAQPVGCAALSHVIVVTELCPRDVRLLQPYGYNATFTCRGPRFPRQSE
jgi:hypothetical protein